MKPPKKKVKKQVQIIVFATLAVALIFLLTPYIVGKATGEFESELDVTFDGDIDVKISPGYFDSVPANGVNIGNIYFVMAVNNMDLCKRRITVEHQLGWGFEYSECKNKKHVYGLATVSPTSFSAGDTVFTLKSDPAWPDYFRVTFSPLQLRETGAGTNLFPGTFDFVFGQRDEIVVRRDPTIIPSRPAPQQPLEQVEEQAPTPPPTPTSSSSRRISSKPAEISLTCKQSWVCGGWSPCSNSKQFRNCIDESSCKPTKKVGGKVVPVTITTAIKPDETRSCTQPSSYTPPQKPLIIPPAPVVQIPAPPSFWELYKWYLLAGLLLLLLLLLIIIVLVHHSKPHKIYNYDELADWIKLAKKKGLNRTEIKQEIREMAGWKDKDIKKAFALVKPEA
jgi:hypothetical protein